MKVDEVCQMKYYVELVLMGYFDFFGQVEVFVIYNKGEVKSGRVCLLLYGIILQISGSMMIFMLDCLCNLFIEVNGDIFYNFYFFVNLIDENCLKKLKDKNLIYFVLGIYQLFGDIFNVFLGKMVYVVGGVIVCGCICVVNVCDVKILGWGEVYFEGCGVGISIINL